MVTTLATLALLASAVSPVSPGTSYDPAIPALDQVTGHPFGERIATPDEIDAYLEALAAAAPDRTELLTYATSEEGRPLKVLVIGSPERMADLEGTKAGLARLADPRGLPPEEADRLVGELPAVVWLLHGVHGNEISSPEAGLALAHHLLAARDDEDVALIRREAVVLIDPLQNPDGRARFIATNTLAEGPAPNPEPLAAEHVEPWPGGRGSHYLFDMNRDWFARTQPETRGRLAVFLEWWPQIAVDLHEMGGNATYYFAPPATPHNPHLVAAQQQWLERIGRAVAARFDEEGVAYFVREVFDAFYPGYGETWPMLHGTVGMTFEQASARGLVFRRDDDTELTYLEGIRHHFTAALETTLTAARGRESLLRDFLRFRQSAVEEGDEGPVREYVLLAGADPARARRLAALLVEQGIEVSVADEELRSGSRRLPVGTFVVPLAQPAGRLVRDLLDPQVPMDEAFVEEQKRRRAKRLPSEIYDVTAWSLPLVFDVECVGLEEEAVGSTRPWTPEGAATAPLEEAQVAWLLPWGTATAGAVTEALREGLKVRVAAGKTTLGGRTFPPGTAIVRRSENPEDARETLARLAARHRAEVVAVSSGYPESGVSLGSFRVHWVPPPRVLLLWDTPTSSLSVGWARWVLERRYGQAVSVVRVSTLERVELDRFDVLVLPSGRYGKALDEEMVNRLKVWIRGGGTLVALAEAARWLTDEDVGLLATTTELRGGCPDVPPNEGDEGEAPKETCGETPGEPYELSTAIQPERERPDAVPGALLRVRLDPDHWLSAGTDGEIQVIVDSRRVFSPLKLDEGTNVGVYASKEDVVASGLVWDETRDQLAGKAYLMHQPLGDGHVIAFAEDPNYRGYAETTELLFMNAVLLGPAY
jgi:hypothetical protein